MAILLEKDLNVMGELPVDQIYIRFSYILRPSGKDVRADVHVYYNKESFKANQLNMLRVDGLPTTLSMEYDSENDGNILLFIHERFEEMLTTDIFRDEIDPSTGETIQVIDRPKFCDEEDISFVDL